MNVSLYFASYHTGTIIVLISITFYIPQDRLKSILNELIELASLIKLSSLFQARMSCFKMEKNIGKN